MFDPKGLKDINDAAARNAVAIDLQEKILAAQAQQAALIEHASQLEKEVAALKVWDVEKARYQLIPIADGVTVYAQKRGAGR